MKKILNFTTQALKKTLIFGSVIAFVCFLAIFSQFYKKNQIKNNLHKNISKSQWKSIKAETTSFKSLGAPGATIFKNLFYQNNQFLVAQSESEDLKLDSILNDEGTYNYSFQPCNQSKIEKQSHCKNAKRLLGTTMILASSKEMKSMQPHYFHFCEEFLLAYSAYKDQNLPPVQTIIFPDIDNWKGRVNDVSEKIIRAIFPNAQVIPASEFQSLSKKYLLQFENAILVDRHACHLNHEVVHFNKMVMAHTPYIKKEYIHEIRDALLKSLKTKENALGKPYITYIMRKSYRYLEPEFEKKFLKEIAAKFPDLQLNPVWFEDLTFAEQMQVIRNTKVLIGAHGNGLTHQLFLPSTSLVIEIFPDDAYSMDYQLFAELSGHTYYGIDPKNGIISKPGTRMQVRGNVNQIIQKFDPQLVTNLIQDFVSSDAELSIKETSSLE